MHAVFEVVVCSSPSAVAVTEKLLVFICVFDCMCVFVCVRGSALLRQFAYVHAHACERVHVCGGGSAGCSCVWCV